MTAPQHFQENSPDTADCSTATSNISPQHQIHSPSLLQIPQNPQNLSLSPQEALQKVGSQMFLSILMALSFSTVGHISYALAYLQNKKLTITCYKQDGTIDETCTAQQACNSNFTNHYKIRLDNQSKSLRNWVYDFDLLCVSDHTISWLGTSFFIGFLIGSAVFMWMSDHIGRKIIVQCGLVLHIAIVILVLEWHKIEVLFAFLIIFGLRVPMAAHVGSLMTYQMVGQRIRSYSTSVLTILDGTTNIWLPVFFYCVEDWRVLFYISIGLVVFVFLLVTFFVPQSPRILIAKKNFKKARQSYKKIAWFNGKTMFDEPIEGENNAPIIRTDRSNVQVRGFQQYNISSRLLDQNHINSSNQGTPLFRSPRNSGEEFNDNLPIFPDEQMQQQQPQQQPAQKKQSQFKQLFKGPLRSQMFIIPFLFFSVDIVFYGILFGLKNLKGNIYINGLMVGIADVSAGISLAFLSNILGRKGLIRITWAICGIACFIYNTVQVNQIASYITILIGKYGATCSFSLMFLISSEIFPTSIRGQMVGISNACARIGGAIAPLMGGYLGENMMYVFGGLAVVSFILAFWLRETNNCVIKDEVKEAAEKNQNQFQKEPSKKIKNIEDQNENQ